MVFVYVEVLVVVKGPVRVDSCVHCRQGSEAIYFTRKMSSHLCLVILLINKQRDDSPFACTVHVNNTLLFWASLLPPWLANFYFFSFA